MEKKPFVTKELIEEVGVDAARFFFNMREANTHCDFDLDLAVEQSSSNPVYYCQYAHARICSIFKKAAEKGIEFTGCTKEQAKLLTADEEKELIRYISSLPSEVEAAAKALDPSRLTRFAIELSTLFHKFYNACRCDVDDEALRTARLYLCRSTGTVLKNILGLLKVDALEAM